MKRMLLIVLLLIAGCSHEDLKAPCRHPSLASLVGDCGPLEPINR